MAEPITAERAVNGVTLFERQIGAGPMTIVLHGGPGADHGYLLPGFDRLVPGRTLLYYDQRGGGRSPVDRDVPTGWQDHVADLEALRQLHGQNQLSIAGYSWGGLLAMLYATQYPTRVSALALVSPAPAWRGGREAFEHRLAARNNRPEVQAARQEAQQGGLRERDLAGYRQRMFELSVAGYFHEWRRAHELTPFRITGRTQQAVWDSLGDYDLRPELAKLEVRSIVVHGEDDPIPIETAEETAGLLRAPLVRIPECGHVPYVEAPEAFRKPLDEFLARA